ncbi:unnamed protein product [Polarella glacialis]|uniref:ShKT domain-containing protein n=1 Tax=Polarella glacialis TaxID=89957 RepID=A0A813IPQ5_POLGL|nr:unnamed protein product [Polarella glacialis]
MISNPLHWINWRSARRWPRTNISDASLTVLLATGLLALSVDADRCPVGSEVISFCRKSAADAESGSGCFASFASKVTESSLEHLTLRLPGASEEEEQTFAAAWAGNEALAWVTKSLQRSCDREAEIKDWQRNQCHDWKVVPLYLGEDASDENMTCEGIKSLCGRGLNAEAYCQKTCGLCSSKISVHFWGRVLRYESREQYVSTQSSAMVAKIDRSWVLRQDIIFLAKYIRESVPAKYGNAASSIGLCHGTRKGLEQKWFMEELDGYIVWGTEISDHGQLFPYTLVWDFHHPIPMMAGKASFIFSNTIDHAHNPASAIRAWMASLVPDGVLLLEGGGDGAETMTPSDPYEATMAQMQRLVLLSGPFQICDILKLGLKRWLVVAHEARGPCRKVFQPASPEKAWNACALDSNMAWLIVQLVDAIQMLSCMHLASIVWLVGASPQGDGARDGGVGGALDAFSLAMRELACSCCQVGDLAALLAKASGADHQPSLAVGGFTLLRSEPLAALLREDDELMVCPGRADSIQDQEEEEDEAVALVESPVTAEVQLTGRSHRAAESSRSDRRSEEQSARVAELEALTAEQATDIARLEAQVAQLGSRLSVATREAKAAKEHANLAETRTAPRPVTVPVAEKSWRRLEPVGHLPEGSVIKYRLDLVDGWSKRSHRSAMRMATVAKLLPGQDGGLVLRHEGGAMDVVEASRLRDVQVLDS